jgi:hypothetical protein
MTLQKHWDAFIKASQRLAEAVAMKNRKARKRPEKWLSMARNGAEITIFTYCFY